VMQGAVQEASTLSITPFMKSCTWTSINRCIVHAIHTITCNYINLHALHWLHCITCCYKQLHYLKHLFWLSWLSDRTVPGAKWHPASHWPRNYVLPVQSGHPLVRPFWRNNTRWRHDVEIVGKEAEQQLWAIQGRRRPNLHHRCQNRCHGVGPHKMRPLVQAGAVLCSRSRGGRLDEEGWVLQAVRACASGPTPRLFVRPITAILGKVPMLRAGDTGTIPFSMRGYERTYYPGGKCDSAADKGDGSRLWYVNTWAMKWSQTEWKSAAIPALNSCCINVLAHIWM